MQLSKALKIARRIVYLVLPIILLWLIFRKIDIPLLFQNLKSANPYIIGLAILVRPVQILIGSLRWYFLTRFYSNTDISLFYMIQQFWGSMVIGFFTPGSIGWDAYRVAVVGKKLQKYTVAFITILAEKFAALMAVLLLALGIFPFISDYLVQNKALLWEIYYWSIAALLIFAAGLFVTYQLKLPVRRVSSYYYKRVQRRIVNSISNQSIQKKIRADLDSSESILSVFKKPKLVIITMVLSFSNLVVSAFSSYLVFIALNYEISFLINLFASPVFFLLFIIPISIGSLGVREGAFIVLFGQFGVPMEIALLVSFFNLLGIFLNNIIGAGFLFSEGLQKNIPDLKKL